MGGNLKPVAIDLFCGLGGWTKGFLAEGYEVIGFDIEHKPSYPGQFINMDIAKLSGYDLRAVNPTVIVASPPCQAYSYRAMPWKRAKALPPPSNALFDACFRIAREAGCPLVVENVKGAQPWVGRAKARFGSYYLWGNIASVGGAIVPERPVFGCSRLRAEKAQKFNPDGTDHGTGSWFKIADSKNRGSRKNIGGSWFNQAHNTASGVGHNPVNGVKVAGISFSGYGTPGYKPKGFNVTAAQRYREEQGIKQNGSGPVWLDTGIAKHSSRSDSRKAASAAIAEIPYPLSNWIARVFKP